MKKFFSFRRNKSLNSAPTNERARMSRSMPGEVAAMVSLRLGGMSF
jgi:hypothetical protein